MRYTKYFTALISVLFSFQAIYGGVYNDMFVYPPYGHSMGIHKVNVATYKMIYGKSVSFAEAGGISAVKLKEKDAKTLSDDDKLTIFLADQIKGDILYNIGLNKLVIFRDSLRNPVVIKANATGDLLVGDVGKRSVELFKYRNDSLVYIRTILRNVIPKGLDFGDGKNIFVSDAMSEMLLKVSLKGKIMKSVHVDLPGRLAVIRRANMWQIGGPTEIFVIADNGTSVYKFDGALHKTGEFDTPSFNLHECGFTDIATDFYRNLYLVDNRNNRIVKLSEDLKYICSFGSFGTGDKEFYYPEYISIWKRFGQIFVVDANGISYYWMGVDGSILDVSPPTLTKKYPGITFVIFSTDYAIAKVKIYDGNSRVVRSFILPRRLKPGKNNILWDGKSNNGKMCHDGRYIVKIELDPTYSSRGYFTKVLTSRVVIKMGNTQNGSIENKKYEKNWF